MTGVQTCALPISPTVGDAGEGTAFYQVLSTAGDTRLGGDDIDHAIVELVTSEIGRASCRERV